MPLTPKDIEPYADLEKTGLDGFTDLGELENQAELRVLHLSHWHKVESLDLSPITKCSKIKFLTLTTAISWDGTNRVLKVDTFAPLKELKELETLQILGVVALEDSLTPLAGISSLKKVSIGNTNHYQLEDFASLSRLAPHLQGLEPITQMNFLSTCRKCRDMNLLFLNGANASAQKYVCPKCNLKLIEKHLQRWNLAEGSPSYPNLNNLDPKRVYEEFKNPEAN